MRYTADHKAQARKRLLEKAGALAKTRGFGTTGVDALVKAAGLTSGAFYAHFSSKSEMLAALVANELERSLELFRDLAASCRAHEIEDAKDQLEAAIRHAEIIERFGRFPHRNATLGRASTVEELEFLAGPNSSF